MPDPPTKKPGAGGQPPAASKTVAVPTAKILGSIASPEAAGDELGRIPLPEGWEISLDVIDGPDTGKSFQIKQSRVLIGRSVDVTLDDPRVSRRHASLEVYGAACVLLKDLDSTNGTFVNSRRVRTVELQDGDEIQVGGTTLSLTLGTPP